MLQGNFWGWMSVAGRFISSFVYMGSSKALGVLIPHLVQQFNSTEGVIGLCTGLFAGMPHFSGPLTTVLVDKYGSRAVVMVGGLLSSVFFFSAAMSTTEIQLGIGLALAGFCNGLCMLASIISIASYFPDKFALANGISSSGAAVGMMLLPPITEMLVELYGWRGTMALLAALDLHCVLAGAMIKPIHSVYESPTRTIPDHSSDTVSSQIERHTVKEIWSYVSDVVKARIFQIYPSFVEYMFMFLILGTNLTAWMLFLVPDSLNKGVSSSAAAYLSTIGGVGHVFGRLIQGLLIDWGLITDLQLFGAMSITCAISFLVDPWITGYGLLAISAFNVGFATGVQYTVSLSMTKRLVTDGGLLLAALSWTHLFIGIGKLCGGPIVGYIYDATGAYVISFITLGALEVVSIIIVLQLELKTRLTT